MLEGGRTRAKRYGDGWGYRMDYNMKWVIRVGLAKKDTF